MMYEQGTITWIESSGGPLLLLASDLLPLWTGAGDLDFDQDMPSPRKESDYERACRVNDYLGVTDVAQGSGLVLDDEPLPTAWWPSPEPGGTLVRWVACKDPSTIAGYLKAHEDLEWVPSGIVFAVTSDQLYLFDAATPGYEVTEFLNIIVPKDRYYIDTCFLRPDDQTEFILHRLRPRQR
jgi:hypothetical protein